MIKLHWKHLTFGMCLWEFKSIISSMCILIIGRNCCSCGLLICGKWSQNSSISSVSLGWIGPRKKNMWNSLISSILMLRIFRKCSILHGHTKIKVLSSLPSLKHLSSIPYSSWTVLDENREQGHSTKEQW